MMSQQELYMTTSNYKKHYQKWLNAEAKKAEVKAVIDAMEPSPEQKRWNDEEEKRRRQSREFNHEKREKHADPFTRPTPCTKSILDDEDEEMACKHPSWELCTNCEGPPSEPYVPTSPDDFISTQIPATPSKEPKQKTPLKRSTTYRQLAFEDESDEPPKKKIKIDLTEDSPPPLSRKQRLDVYIENLKRLKEKYQTPEVDDVATIEDEEMKEMVQKQNVIDLTKDEESDDINEGDESYDGCSQVY
jgi:hypothetical protein